MSTNVDHTTPRRSRAWIAGAVITGLLGVFFAFDAIPKILGVSFAREAVEGLGFSPDKTAVIGWVLLVCLVLFLIPRTAVLGALGLTAYLGGAVTINLHAEELPVVPIVMAVGIGVLTWVGLILRRPELLSVLGLRRD